MGLSARSNSASMMGVDKVLDVEGQLAEQSSPPSSIEILCLFFHCPYDLFGELWRRVKMEVVVEWPMLKQRWLLILFGVVMQYVHGIFTQLAHRMHQPQEQPLHDVGFELTPELGPDKHWVSETLFAIMFVLFVLWTFSPFVTQHKRFYTAVMWSRILMVLVVCQALRIITFTVTQLPGPSFHCRAGQEMAIRPWPGHWTGHVVVDVQRAAHKSCGDLLFSSHTIFMLTGLLAFNEYGGWPAVKAIAWVCGGIISCLIIASRKHYTVDVVVAWYTVPLVFYTLHRRWTTRRPMSELLGALGENDEPDPGSSSSNDDDEVDAKVQVYMGKSGGNESGNKVNTLSHAKGRTSSAAKLGTTVTLGSQQLDHHALDIDTDRASNSGRHVSSSSGRQHSNTARVRNMSVFNNSAGEGVLSSEPGGLATGSGGSYLGLAGIGAGAGQRVEAGKCTIS